MSMSHVVSFLLHILLLSGDAKDTADITGLKAAAAAGHEHYHHQPEHRKCDFASWPVWHGFGWDFNQCLDKVA